MGEPSTEGRIKYTQKLKEKYAAHNCSALLIELAHAKYNYRFAIAQIMFEKNCIDTEK